jgi:hypothetical protein
MIHWYSEATYNLKQFFFFKTAYNLKQISKSLSQNITKCSLLSLIRKILFFKYIQFNNKYKNSVDPNILIIKKYISLIIQY